MGSVTDGPPQKASTRWLAWNDRDRWLAARLLVIVLGVGLMFAEVVLPSPKDGCEYDPACVVEDVYAVMWFTGLAITLTAIAVWASGKHAEALAVLEGLTLLALGSLYLFTTQASDSLTLSPESGLGVFVLGIVLFVVGTLSALYKGFTRLRARGGP